MNKIHLIILAAAAMLPLSVRAQYAWQDGAEAQGKLDLGKDVRYQVEMQGSFLAWQDAVVAQCQQVYGLSSLSSTNGYLRGSLVRPLSLDSARRWGIGYGADVACSASLHQICCGAASLC